MKLNLYKLYGGKYYHAPWIINEFPDDYRKLTYLEPCLGAGNITLQCDPAYKEILSDLHYPTYCAFLSAQNGSLYDAVRYLTYSEATFKYYLDFVPQNILDHAVREYVLHRMSRGGMKKSFAWSERLRGGIPGDVNAWNNAVANLPAIQRRYKDSIFLNEDCFTLLDRYKDVSDLFCYIDPPYLLETRTSKSVYDVEFTDVHHERLLAALGRMKGRWLLSGYDSKLYRDTLGSPKAQKTVKLSSSQAKKKNSKVEMLWSNY